MSKATTDTRGTASTPTSDPGQTTTDDGGRPDDASRDDDELFEILANQRRRFALHYLRGRPAERVSLSELSEHVAGWEHGVDPASLDYGERKSVRNSLHQFHLPKLDDAGIVDYDTDASDVRLVDTAGSDAYHDVLNDDDDASPWSAGFLGASVGALATYGLAALDVLAMASTVVWGVAFVGLVAVAATLFVRQRSTRWSCRGGPPPECDD